MSRTQAQHSDAEARVKARLWLGLGHRSELVVFSNSSL